MMTQRAKLRRLAFIDLPSWSRGSRPLSLVVTLEYSLGSEARIPGPLHPNLGGARVNATRTKNDYVTHLKAESPSKHHTKTEVFLGWLRLLVPISADIVVCGRLLRPTTPPGRCRIDVNSAPRQADRGPGQRLFQLPAIGRRPVQHG